MKTPKPSRCASIDIGSNTVRLLIVDTHCSPPDKLHPLFIDSDITRLGEDFKTERTIKKRPEKRTLVALKKFSKTIDRLKVQRVAAAGTAVLREASNRETFLDEVYNKTGIKTRVLSGIEEAQLSLKGISRTMGIRRCPLLIFDIGGGSTEVIYSPESNIGIHQPYIKSLPIGVVPLTEEFLPTDPPGEKKCEELKSALKPVFKEVYMDILNVSGRNPGFSFPEELIGTAGTPTTLAAMFLKMHQYDPKKITGTRLQYAWLVKLARKLFAMPLRQRRYLAGLENGREDVILAGLLVVIVLMETFHFSSLVVSDAGLLEGLAWDLIDPDPLINWE